MARSFRPPRKPSEITLAALERAALRYLERFAASSEHLRRVLLRRVSRAALLGSPEAAGGAALVDGIVERYLKAGLLDDRTYAVAQAGSLQRRGTSRHRIRQRLAAKGVARDLVEDALAGLDDEPGTGELAAACALARKRRLGPYRPPGQRSAYRQKDLAALARAGFTLDLARRVLAARDLDALDRLMREDDEA
jgi:regulatory protein